MGEFSGIGLAPGVVRGVRSFKVDKLGRLTGIHYEQVWRPGENGAECRKKDADPWSMHSIITAYDRLYTYRPQTYTVQQQKSFWRGTREVQVPVAPEPAPVPAPDPPHSYETCKCGFYAYYDGSDDYHQEGYISGVVEGYGETLIGTRGFRAMKARIVALHIPTDVPVHLSRLVARNYAEVAILPSFNDMVTEFPPDGGSAELTPETDPEFWTRSL